MNLKLKNLLQSQSVDVDRIYNSPIATLQDQAVEMALRERVAET